MTPAVELHTEARENGFAAMLADLLRQNLDDKPHRRRGFQKMVGRVAIVLEDLEVAVTLVFQGGRVDIYNGIVGIPDLAVRTTSDDATQMSLIEMTARFDLPNLRGPIARQLLQEARQGRVRIYGGIANWPLLLRLTRVMSIN